ncbi:hypothetical protein N7475_003065 [Penicillium sp. IBT 31633x]|nr:hypothetical protein N7475_003065 [Penicillium sp. IBT 31633x]
MSTAGVAALAAGFSDLRLFPFLPAELRLKIWRFMLPEIDPPALTPYRPGCWHPVSPPENGDTTDDENKTVELRFQPEQLDYIRVKIPLSSVTFEARSVVIEWAREQGIEVSYHAHRKCEVFLRPFDQMRDVIWIGQNHSTAFNIETWGATDANDRHKYTMPTGLKRYAISQWLLDEGMAFDLLCDTICCFSEDVVLYIVCGQIPRFTPGDPDRTRVQPRWQLDGTQDGLGYTWNRSKRKFDSLPGRRLLNPHSYNRVTHASKMIAQGIRNYKPRKMKFELRGVVAVRY